MNKYLLSALAFLPLVLLAPKAFAQDYTYDCVCLYSNPGGTCMEYTCDAYRRSSRYNNYYDNNNCDYRYDSSCNDPGPYYRRITYRPRTYDSSSSYYDSRYDYDWYYRRYTGRSSSYYDRTNYDTPYYY